LDQINAAAREVAATVARVPGAVDVRVKSPPGAPRVVIKLRPEHVTQFGFHPADLLADIQAAYQGSIAGQVYEANRAADIAVILDQAERRNPAAIGLLQFRNSAGLSVPLREIAKIFMSSGPYSILHEGARRRQTITCGSPGRDLNAFVNDARAAVAKNVKFSGGTYAAFSGAAEAAAVARKELLLHSAIAGVAIFLLLAIALGNARNLLLVLANIPFALIGGIIALAIAQALAGQEAGGLTIGSLVGFVTLFGITMRNSIMLISHFEHLVNQEGAPWSLETAVRGASERLMPISITALVTALGLLPLALGSGGAGREIEGPMAIVILGGLATSTILNLLCLPALALHYGKFARSLLPPLARPLELEFTQAANTLRLSPADIRKVPALHFRMVSRPRSSPRSEPSPVPSH
jgi:Cu/Ag efflux pump CusA